MINIFTDLFNKILKDVFIPIQKVFAVIGHFIGELPLTFQLFLYLIFFILLLIALFKLLTR